jgi:hypothetical protein
MGVDPAMNQKLLASGLLVAVLVVGGLGAAMYTGVGPAPGSGPSAESDTETTDDQAATEESPFTFTVDEIDDCGETCRDVTATVDNTQDEPAESVTVSTSIFAGENSTEEVVWEGTEEIGTLAAGDAHTSTKRVDLSLSEAYAVDENDGWITIVTTIDSDDETITVRESRQVG